MVKADYDEFSSMLDAVCSLLSRGSYIPNGANTALFFRALAAYPIADVRAAFDAHVRDPQRGKFVPTPADVIAQLDGLAANDGRPDGDEAWSTALLSADERETVVWTEEMQEAFCIARPVLDAGDRVGARMAFRDAYNRMVEEARKARRGATWSVSEGFDVAKRGEAIRKAVAANRLQGEHLHALPAPAMTLQQLAYDAPAPSATPKEIKARRRLRELFDQLRAAGDAPSSDAEAKEQTAAAKADVADRIAAYLESQRGPDVSELGEYRAPDLQNLPPAMRRAE